MAKCNEDLRGRRGATPVFCRYLIRLSNGSRLTPNSDLKGMAKIASGIIILRKGGNTDWTTDLDNQMNSWTKEFIQWLETAGIALEEGLATKCVSVFFLFFFCFLA